MTMGALSYFKASGINVPDDISIASYGSMDNIDLMYVQPSTAALNLWITGKKAGEMILERISNNNDIGYREVIFATQLAIGNGVKAV
jgi:DNA-binding LacI/PurR family transcriptional regulator